MNDLIVKIEKSTRKVELEQIYIGNDHENLQEKLIFQFDTFIDGQGRLEYEISGTKNYIILTKENGTYTIPVQNVITIHQSDTMGKIKFQLVVTEGTSVENVPVFKSNIFYLKCRPSINAVSQAPEGYDLWIEQANAILNEMDNIDLDIVTEDDETKVVITRKDGTEKESVVTSNYDDTEIRGLIAEKQDELISGTNIKTINNESILGSGNINIQGGGGGTSDYTDLENKPSINNVTLNGNKSLNDLGIQPAGSYLTSETDPVFSASASANITSSDILSWNSKGTYSKPNGGIPSTDLSSDVQTSLGKADTALQSISSSDVTTALGYTPYNSSNPNGYTSNTGTITGITMNGASKGTSGVVDLGTVITSHQDISGKQNVTDNTLTTTNKTVPTAINEVNSIAKGANQALSYSNYQAMITAFNSLDDDVYNVGQNVMIVTLEVPDLWISGIESTSSTYIYTTDSAIVSDLQITGYIQVGYYKLSMLETQKVDLTNYVTNTDYSTPYVGGVVKTINGFAVGMGAASDVLGCIYAITKTYQEYQSISSLAFVGKGTLENVLTGKGLIKATSISSSSTDDNVATPKAVYDYIQSLDASEVIY